MKKFSPFLHRSSLLLLALLGLVAFSEPGPSLPPPTRTKPLPALPRRSHEDAHKPATHRRSPLTNDPLGFTVRSNEDRLRVGQPLRLTITVRHLNLPPSLLFTFPEANAFRLKLLVPEGFVITGGTYHDYVGGTIGFGQPPVIYTVDGYFTHLPTQPQFRLLRGGGQATAQSQFVEKARLSVTVLPYRDQAARLAAFTACVEAETSNGNGNRSSFSDGQASGGQAVGGFGNASEFMEYTLTNAPSGGSYTLRLFYVSGDSQAGIGLVVNGVLAQVITAPGVGRQSGPYLETTTTINLNPGNNTLRIQGSGQGGFTLDKFCLEGNDTPPASLVINPSGPQSAGPGAGSLSVSVTATNVPWSASSSEGSWLTLSPSSGNANGSVTVSYAANPTTSARSASISFSGPGVTTQTLTLNQAGATANPGYAQCIEAETSNGNGNRNPQSDSQASGGSYVSGFGNASEFMEYTLSNVPSGGSYTLRLFYVSGDSQAVMSAVVNGGTVQTVTAPGVGRWTGPYVETTTTINLNAGSNTLRVQGSGQSAFSLDKLCVEGGTTNPCTPPTLSLGTPACNGTSTYSVGFTAQSGANVTSSAGTVQGSQVVNIPVGTNATVTAALNGCTSQQTVTSCTSSTCLASFRRAIVVGNSFTSHSASTALNWFQNNGMAASNQASDYVHRIETALKTRNSAFEIQASGNGSRFETDYNNNDPDRIVNIKNSIISDIEAKWGAAEKMDLLVISISENTNNAGFDESKFRAGLDELITGLRPKLTAGVTILFRNGLWLDHESADAALRRYALDKGYKFADMADLKETRVNGTPTWPYYATNYSNDGVRRHPNDAGHQAIANRFLSQLTTATPCSSTVTPPVTPTSRTYNYPIVPVGTVGGWNAYNPNTITENGTHIIGDVARLENATVLVEIRKTFGGATQVTDKRTGRQLINWNDWGRQAELCLYGGPKNYGVAGGGQWFDIGYNPILQGNHKDTPSPIEAAGWVTGNDNRTVFYTKTRLMSWASGATGSSNPPVLTDTWVEKWTDLNQDEVSTRTRTTNNRSDETFYDGSVGSTFQGSDGVTRTYYEGVGQEYPNMMVTGNRANTKYYIGDKPYTNDTDGRYLISTSTRENSTTSFEEGVFHISEPWMAVEYDQAGHYIFLNTERFGAGGNGCIVPNVPNETQEDANPGTVTRCAVSLIMDPKGVWYHDYAFFVTDNFQAGRTWANSKKRIHGDVPNWTFDKDHGRNDWVIDKGFDQREPFTDDNWKAIFKPTSDNGSPANARRSSLASPHVSHKASLIPTLYVRMKYAGPADQFRIEFLRNGQRDRGLDSDKPNQMAAQFPNGQANGGTQALTISNLIKDGQFHTYAIPTSQTGEWRDIIQQYKINYGQGAVIGQNDPLEVAYFGVNNPGN